MVASDIIKGLEQSSLVREMFEKGNELKAKYGEDAVFDFSLGNPVLEPPAEFYLAIKELINKSAKGAHGYMSNAGLKDVRKSIANKLSEEHSIDFSEEHIIMTVGASGGLNVIFKTILNLSEVVFTYKPYFMEYYHYVKNHGGRISVLNTDEQFQPQVELLKERLGFETKALLINTPNNPTGAVYSEQKIAEIGEALSWAEDKFNHPIFLISDEPYNKLIYDGHSCPSIFQAHKNSLIVTSHSKDYGLAGERIGYIAINPKADNWRLLSEALSYSNRILGFVNAPAMMQRVLPYIYESKLDIAKYKELRDVACDVLTEAGIEYTKPAGAFYVFPKSPLEDDVKFAEIAANHGVLVVPGSGFAGRGNFRMSYSVDKEKLLKSKDKFKQIMAECAKY